MIPNSFDYIFEAARADTSGREYIVKTSMLEIYNEEIRDLLGKDPKAKMNLREEKGKGVYVQGLAAYVASCPEVRNQSPAPPANRRQHSARPRILNCLIVRRTWRSS